MNVPGDLAQARTGNLTLTVTAPAGSPVNTAPIAMGLLGARVDNPEAPGYLLHFEIVSVHLLVVLVGAAYLARAKRKAAAPWAVASGQ